ncbi:hypothetical protein GOODEAATRI_004010 [Goodea atripinnis]|uniref:Uncharacterized protein n=1 Tax=Goodea atripinnis TaxID=208336 RepID=A0ABV0PV21_9TELE
MFSNFSLCSDHRDAVIKDRTGRASHLMLEREENGSKPRFQLRPELQFCCTLVWRQQNCNSVTPAAPNTSIIIRNLPGQCVRPQIQVSLCLQLKSLTFSNFFMLILQDYLSW